MRVTITIILLFVSFLSYGQVKKKLKGQPKTLEETFIYLDNIFDDTAKYDILTIPEDVSISRLQFNRGMWIRNKWGLWRGSKLRDYFLDKGIRHPDNMSDIILTSYYRYLNNKPINLDEQIMNYQELYESDYSINEISKGRTTDSMLLIFFPVGDTILTSVSITKKRLLGGIAVSCVTATAVVRGYNNDMLVNQILTIRNKPKWKPKKQVGDIQVESPYFCCLIPSKNWRINKINYIPVIKNK